LLVDHTASANLSSQRFESTWPVLDWACGPDCVQIRSSSEGLHLESVPAAILEEPSMQRLMQVCHEVHDVLEGLQAVVFWRA